MIYPSIDIDHLEDVLNVVEKWKDNSTSVFTEHDYQRLSLLKENPTEYFIKPKAGFLEQYLQECKENIDMFTPDSLDIINKLLGDTKLKKKCKIINDGSFVNNRIWWGVNVSKQRIQISVDLDHHYDDSCRGNKDKIDWLYNHL